MAFKHYLEEEDDKPYFTTNSLGYYYDKMEGFAEKVEQAAKVLNVTKEEIEKRIGERLQEWDGKLEAFDGSVLNLLSEWVDDGTLTHVIDSTLIDKKIAPVAAQLAEKVGGTKKATMNDLGQDVKEALTGGSVAVVGPGAVGPINIQPKAVTASKTDFFTISTNLLNTKVTTKDKTIDPATGQVIDNAGGNSVLPFFPAKANTIYTDFRTNRRAFYDAAKNYLGTSVGDVNGGAPTFTTPANTSFIQMVVPTGYLSTAQLNEGNTKLPYEPYYVAIMAETFPEKGITNEKLSNLHRLKIINQGTVDFDFTNKLIKFTGVSVLHGKSEITITQNLDITSLNVSSRHILFYNTATNLLGTTDMTVLAIPETAIAFGMFRIGLNNVWGMDNYKVNGTEKITSDLKLATVNNSGQNEPDKRYPVKSDNLSPLASKVIVSGSPVNFDFLNNKISISNGRLIFGNRSEWITNAEMSTTGLVGSNFYILYYNLLTTTLGAVNQSYSTEYGSLNENTLILGTFHINNQYVEGLTNYTINGKSYKLMSPDDVGKSDYAMLDTNLSKVFTKNVTIPSQNTEIEASTASTVYAMYDAFVSRIPNFTRKLEATDATGLPIYSYEYKPYRAPTAQTERKPKMIYLSGTHPERTAVWTLYNTIKNIFDNWKDDSTLETLRFNVGFIVMPLVNPHSYNSKKRTNSNGVDINRNFPKDWEYADATVGSNTYRGTTPLSEIESQTVNNLMLRERNNILGLIDFHNFDIPADNYYFLLGFPGNNFTSNIMSNLIQRMDRKWKKEYSFVNQAENVFLGRNETIIPGALNTQAAALGIKGAIAFEVDYKVFASPTSTYNDSLTMTMGYEAFVNFLAMFTDELVKYQ